MGLTDMLQDNVKREQIQDFVKRYDQGKPSDGISDQEAQQQHDQVAAQLDDSEYEQSAKESFERLDPQESASRPDVEPGGEGCSGRHRRLGGQTGH